ncbi:BRO-N domain-containing protein [Humidesulfovibrio sp.]
MNSIPAQHPNTNPLFSFGKRDLRVVMIDGAPWFAAPDVLCCLGLDYMVGSTNWTRTLDADEKRLENKTSLSLKDIQVHGKCWNPKVSLVSESGMYKLIMRANPGSNPVVARFQNRGTRAVLPALRKDGMYVMGEEKVKTGEMSEDELVLKALTLLQGKVSRLSTEVAEQKAIIDEHLMHMTVQEWLANKGVYLRMSDAQALGRAAKKVTLESGGKITKERKKLPHPHDPRRFIDSEVNVYPLAALNTAARSLGYGVKEIRI